MGIIGTEGAIHLVGGDMKKSEGCTVALRKAGSKLKVPIPFVHRNRSGPWIERSTWLSAAKSSSSVHYHIVSHARSVTMAINSSTV